MILLVENNAINISLTTKLLEKYGWHFELAVNGEQALMLLASGEYDLILVDVTLQDISGFELAEAIRDLESNCFEHIPIFALTDLCLPDVRQKCLDAGIDELIVKPINHNEFFKKIDNVLKNKWDFDFFAE